MISHKHKCIFIHIPKCAGTTVEEYLMKHAKAPNYWNAPGLPMLREKGLARTINLYPEYFTFTFVRNPFDRFLSYYFFGLQWKEIRNLPYCYQDFRECIDLTAELMDAQKTGRIEPDKKFGAHQTQYKHLVYERYHAKRQVDFLLDRHPQVYFGVQRLNDAPCSFIGRCESFERDFFRVTDVLGIPRHPLHPVFVSKERLLDKDKRKHYSAYYDKTTRRLVEDLYAEDLEALGYEFEDESAVSVPTPLYDMETVRARRRERAKVLRQHWFKIYARRSIVLRKRVTGLVYKYYRTLKCRFKKYFLGIEPD